MATSIVDSLFGPQPWEVQRAENAQLGKSADQYAAQDPFQRAAGQLYRGGGMLARPAMEAAGYVDPAVQQAQRTQDVMGMGGDVSTAAGLKAKAAQFAAAGDQQTAMKLIMMARQQEAKDQELLINQRKQILSERKQEFTEQDAMDFKKQQLQQAYDLAKEKASDARASAAERASAAREAIQARREIAQLVAGNKPTEPLVQIVGPDNNPIWVTRTDAIGKTPAGAGSKAETVAAGKNEIDRDVVTLKSALDQLKEGGGITSTSKGVLPNISAWTANTGLGQTMGSMGGTNNQKARDVILQARPLLLRSIMQATGMTARSLDSNAELKLWLSTATDPTKGYEANIEALNNIASKYGSGAITDSGTKPIGKPKTAVDAALEKYR